MDTTNLRTMDRLFIEEILLAAALPIIFIGAESVQQIATRLRSRARSRCIADIIRLLLLPDEPDEESVFALQRIYSRRTIIDALCYISAHIYGEEYIRIASIVEICAIEHKLLCSAKRKYGIRRDSKLAILAQIPVTTSCFEDLEYFIDQRDSTYAVIAILASHPERAIRYCTRLRRELSHYEVAIIAEMLRIHGAPVAYTPLLQSENENLQLIGIYIVEQLAMVDAEPLLQALLSSPNLAVATHALRTLCTIHGELPPRNISALMSRMTPSQRDSFLRHAIQSCYTPRSCSFLLNAEEQHYFTAKINSYKCRILCN